MPPMEHRTQSDGVSASPTTGPTGQTDGFASTAWSIVLAAAQDSDGGAALDRLCRRYWKPVYTFARSSGLARADAEDAKDRQENGKLTGWESQRLYQSVFAAEQSPQS